LDKRTKADIDEGLVAIQLAIKLDPTFAPAYASLSEAYLGLGLYEPARGTELLAKAQAASRKALELDESLSAAHYTLAAIRGVAWDWSGAEVEYQRAIKLNPSNALAHLWYSDLLIILGRATEAELETQRAEELDPVSLEVYGAVPGQAGFSDAYLMQNCLRPLLHATRTKHFQYKGKVKDVREVADNDARLRALDKTGWSLFMCNCSASLRASTRSLLLPSCSKAIFRGLHTTTYCAPFTYFCIFGSCLKLSIGSETATLVGTTSTVQFASSSKLILTIVNPGLESPHLLPATFP
jgi:hypothetical protein